MNFKTKQDLLDAFKLYNKAIYNFVFYKVNQNKELAEDISQEVFIRAWINKDKFNPKKGSLNSWLFIIARNITIDSFRKDSWSSNLFDMDTLSSNGSIENDSLREFMLARLYLLNESEKELIILRFIQEMEVKEIAKIVNKNNIATKVAISRAFSKLKKILNEKHK